MKRRRGSGLANSHSDGSEVGFESLCPCSGLLYCLTSAIRMLLLELLAQYYG